MINWKARYWLRHHIGKIVILFVCLLMFIGILQYSSKINQQNYLMLNQQTQALSQIIVRQAAKNAATNIAEKNQDKLQTLAAHLANEPLILDATIYNIEGVTLAKTKTAMPLEQLTGLSTPLAMASLGRQQIAEPVFHQGHIVGFVRVTLERDKLLADATKDLAQITMIVRGLIIAALMLGILLTLSVSSNTKNRYLPRLASSTNYEN